MTDQELPYLTDEFTLAALKPEQLTTLVAAAAGALRWVPADGGGLQFFTNAGNPSYGELVSIALSGKVLTVTSGSIDEYYQQPGRNEANIRRFRQAIELLAERQLVQEKKAKLEARKHASALVLSETYKVTPLIIYLNVAIFLAMVLTGISPLDPDARTLAEWGGNFGPLTRGGQWWRLLSCMFLHGGLMHLAMNMFSLVYIGAFLEPIIGRLRFVAAYMLAGVCGGLVSLAYHPHSVGVGASGAIFGMYGVFLALLTTSYVQKAERKTLIRSILFFVVYNLISGLQGNVDNAAHIGGLAGGFLIGRALYPGVRDGWPLRQQAITVGLLTVAAVGISILALRLL